MRWNFTKTEFARTTVAHVALRWNDERRAWLTTTAGQDGTSIRVEVPACEAGERMAVVIAQLHDQRDQLLGRGYLLTGKTGGAEAFDREHPRSMGVPPPALVRQPDVVSNVF
ncbi:MAG: hypothetical protein A2580_17940 [Hydrogenophilales bacterium RIFOXYD1_FULL_62_11]|nr:MAG: hypothetical protein A2580_17940 [Hydrogenophilales bacterium RIFOXYD1_FULL_62_11]